MAFAILHNPYDLLICLKFPDEIPVESINDYGMRCPVKNGDTCQILMDEKIFHANGLFRALSALPWQADKTKMMNPKAIGRIEMSSNEKGCFFTICALLFD